ncbi:hypothetical protein PF005_g33505 [Phytophthora fragariae]|uniref:Uncharacterized protein n=1 Tax=Phytophthora fragariae TaxID=53985 RepID=A0A6A3UH82_9STRA|nr:hypothetical protein PF003_g13247 [Phytophthora fragariae]KAE8916723.1 hypothetical protein PF009_g32954 [Phytophthora fragariae]KAE8951599.1 hypothetical protein PF011_g32922 [Phytophthora fragariae]KAE9054565.1 hypothetical protein PF007_g32594 [Phytophthora fragariae]KAE9055141.1 hypothetical protein PF006_g33055 [Phytophthora fragariae]
MFHTLLNVAAPSFAAFKKTDIVTRMCDEPLVKDGICFVSGSGD